VPSFLAPINYDAGTNVTALAKGDFNGDGTPDLVAVTSDPSHGGPSLAVLLGNGDGTFQPPRTYVTGPYPTAVAVADLTGSGRFDLVVTNQGDFPDFNGSLSILLGSGDGTFKPAQNIAMPGGPMAVAVGDFNGDHRPDIAVSTHENDMVNVLLGNGDGTFQPARSYAVGVAPNEIVAGDFTGGGRDDLAVTNGSNTLSVLLSNPDGTFGSAVNYNVGNDPFGLAAADFTGSGRLDLVVALDGAVRLLPGNGDGTFQLGSIYSTGALFSGFVTVGEVNQDNLPDLVCTDTIGGKFAVLLNAGGAPSGTPHRHSRGRTAFRGRALTQDFLRVWSAAAPRKDAAALEGVVLPAASLRTERLDNSWAVDPVGGQSPNSVRSPQRLTIHRGADGWDERDQSVSLVLDPVFAGLTGP
jgi:hypothetical protein